MTTPSAQLPGNFETRLLHALSNIVDEQAVSPAMVTQGSGHRRKRRRRVMALVAFAVLGTGTAFAATGWNPIVGDDQRGHPSTATTPPPSEQQAAIGALRRPQTEDDRGSRVQAALRALPAAQFSGVRIDTARLLVDWGTGAIMVLSVEREAQGGDTAVANDSLCLLISSDFATGNIEDLHKPSVAAKCGTLEELRGGDLIVTAPQPGRLRLDGIVPDGVAKVEASLNTGQTVDARVADNAFHIDTRIPTDTHQTGSIRWLDANGNAIEHAAGG